jgi:DnaJ-like protein/uncharacterized protein DUF4388
MDLPGRLRSTTLGDLLGALHRSRVTGTLELAEDSGRRHRVYLSQGLVASVELDGSSPSLAEILRGDRAAEDDVLRRSLLRAMASSRLHGEVLVDDFRLSPEVVGNALRRQVAGRLAILERLADARVSFRVAVRPPRGVLSGRARPLEPHEFLHGRRRRRERDPRAEPSPSAAPAAKPGDPKAWNTLGLPPGAGLTEIKRAYRRLARTVHPDLHPGASDDERRDLQRRFVALTDAYRSLVA